MKTKSTTAIIYSQGLNTALEQNIARLQGWVSEIVVMYLGEPSSFVDKIRSLDTVRVHRTLWRGSICSLRNEARSISRGEVHIHFFENETVVDCSLWPKVHEFIASMTNDKTGRLAIKSTPSDRMFWQSRVFHRSHDFMGEWLANPVCYDQLSRNDIAFCVNSIPENRHFLMHSDSWDALSLDSENPWALYAYAEKKMEQRQWDDAIAILSSICHVSLNDDHDLNHAAVVALIDCTLKQDNPIKTEPWLHITADRVRESSTYCDKMGDVYAARYAASDDGDDYELAMEFYMRSLGAFRTNKLSGHVIGSGSLLTKNKIQKLFDFSRGFA